MACSWRGSADTIGICRETECWRCDAVFRIELNALSHLYFCFKTVRVGQIDRENILIRALSYLWLVIDGCLEHQLDLLEYPRKETSIGLDFPSATNWVALKAIVNIYVVEEKTDLLSKTWSFIPVLDNVQLKMINKHMLINWQGPYYYALFLLWKVENVFRQL